jgi:hypothetical protein
MDRKFFKTDQAFQGFSKLHPKMQEVAEFLIDEALRIGVTEPIITETLTTKEIDKALGRVSSSHSEGRAIDFRTWNLEEYQLKDLYRILNAEYKHIGAITKLGTRQLVVFHDIGKGPHFHIQLDRSFAMPEFRGEKV